ncbi:hypothetical protein A3K63_03430 [Candidatus Micrarchaeota archaeon RBG_16_49_10]|nr:MAG: hypothetical protein A3K63_03430 [Candidatus Micrarchaeota archaeon RBG_16_49_10]
MHEVEQLCERVAFIDGGIVSDIGTIEALKSKKFSTYHVRIGVVKVKYKDMLVSQGFKINGNVLTKDVDNREDPAELIRFLVNKGYDVISFETKHPTLEDYFIKMTRDRK